MAPSSEELDLAQLERVLQREKQDRLRLGRDLRQQSEQREAALQERFDALQQSFLQLKQEATPGHFFCPTCGEERTTLGGLQDHEVGHIVEQRVGRSEDQFPTTARRSSLKGHLHDPSVPGDRWAFQKALTGVTISGGTFNLPAHAGLIVITGEGGVDDDLTDINSAGGGVPTPGMTALLTNASGGNAITVKHSGTIVLAGGLDVILQSNRRHFIALYAATATEWGEMWRSPQLIDAASLLTAGVVEFATTAEIDTGTDSTRAMPIDQFVASLRNVRFIEIRLVASDTDVATGTTIGGDFVIPFTGTLLQDDAHKELLMAYNDTAGVTGTMVVDIHKGGTTIMTTNKLDIETGEKNTRDATTQPDLTTTAVTAGDIFTFDVDSIHSGTAAKGLVVAFAIRLT